MKADLDERTIARTIRDALVRHAEADSDRVHVSINGSRVILRGVLRTTPEVMVAEAAVRGVPGVIEVESHLRSDQDLAQI